MKKVFFAIAAIAATMTITSCGNGSTTQNGTTDSTAVAVDTTQVDTLATPATPALDSTAVVK